MLRRLFTCGLVVGAATLLAPKLVLGQSSPLAAIGNAAERARTVDEADDNDQVDRGFYMNPMLQQWLAQQGAPAAQGYPQRAFGQPNLAQQQQAFARQQAYAQQVQQQQMIQRLMLLRALMAQQQMQQAYQQQGYYGGGGTTYLGGGAGYGGGVGSYNVTTDNGGSVIVDRESGVGQYFEPGGYIAKHD
jgi:hypothetical protein